MNKENKYVIANLGSSLLFSLVFMYAPANNITFYFLGFLVGGIFMYGADELFSKIKGWLKK